MTLLSRRENLTIEGKKVPKTPLAANKVEYGFTCPVFLPAPRRIQDGGFSVLYRLLGGCRETAMQLFAQRKPTTFPMTSWGN
jgi:hypothetical protein